MEEVARKKSLRRSIAATILVYFITQCVIFVSFALPGGFFDPFWGEFLSASAAFHLFLFLLLIIFQDDFRKEATQEKLSSINLANKITLIRVSTLPTLLFLVIAAKHYRIRYPLLVLVIFIFITDFLDGYISRKANEVTKAGRMMDSASDYVLLIVLTLVFRYYRLIPTWFLVLVLTRLGIQVLLMAVLIVINRKIDPKSTFMGKVAVASIMIVYSLEVLGLITGGLPRLLKDSIEWIVAAVILASIGDKIISFVSSLNGAKNERRISDVNDKERP
jgi:phosphatidylglycerophosphate synthase